MSLTPTYTTPPDNFLMGAFTGAIKEQIKAKLRVISEEVIEEAAQLAIKDLQVFVNERYDMMGRELVLSLATKKEAKK